MDEEKPEVVNTTEARQANDRRMNFRVLIFGTLINAAAFALMWFFWLQPDTTI